MKKILALLFCVVFCFTLCSCKNTTEDLSSNIEIEDVSSKTETVKTVINPLTGLKTDKKNEKNKPVAVMINNIKTAQSVQTGLNSFDILYETLVEGGITRMMGVTKNIADMPKIGTVRSARYVYLDLALGHDANFVHAGFDPNYFASHRDQLGIKTIDINSGATAKYGFRQKNGLSSEHTMYTSGEKIAAGIKEQKFKTTTEKNKWINFASEDAPLTPAASCINVKVPFSGSYVTSFEYDAQTGKYIKSSNGVEKTDYVTGEKLAVKNVFVLFTSVSTYSDNYHMNVSLNGGTGYYVSNGGYEEIKWQKGSATEPLTFLKADGTEFTANAGNSYICITDVNQQSNVKFTAAQ